MLGGKDALKKFRKALDRAYNSSGSSSDSSPIAQLRKQFRGVVPMKKMS